MQTMEFGVGKQWDPAIQHSELYLVTCDGKWWRIIMWEKNICMTGSLCYTAEIDRTLEINYNGKIKIIIKNKGDEKKKCRAFINLFS